MTDALTAWWWRRKDNYGDILNPFILSYVANRPIEWANSETAEVIAIGSVLQTVSQRIAETGNPVYVWGSGMMGPQETDFTDKAVLSLVRGPLTATLLGLDDLPKGDPGLLVDEALDISAGQKKHKYGVIPHWMHSNAPEVQILLDALPNARLINMVTDDVHATTQAIVDCEFILSSSLHGLIVADSLSIPNLWIDTGPIGTTTRFKFFDYALSVGRAMPHPHAIETLITSGVPSPETSYFAGLPAIKETIKNAFPQELAA